MKTFAVEPHDVKFPLYDLFIIAAANTKAADDHKQKHQMGKRWNQPVEDKAAERIAPVGQNMHQSDAHSRKGPQAVQRRILLL